MRFVRKHPLLFLLFCVVTAAAVRLLSIPELDILRREWFCVPSAKIAAQLSGTAVRYADGVPEIILSGLKISVPVSCSGFQFFCIAAAVLALSFQNFRILSIPAAYAVTLLVNPVRILTIGLWESGIAPGLPFPLPLQHQCLGMLFFLLPLLFLFLFFNRKELGYERKSAEQ